MASKEPKTERPHLQGRESLVRVSHSKVKTFRRCEKQYEFKYIERLRPKQKSVQLERGSWIHELLMTHYDGEDWRIPHTRLKKAFLGLFEEEREVLGDLPAECARIMQSYLRTYEAEDRRYRVVDTELNEVITLPSGLEIVVVIDLIMEDPRGGLWVWDHKTRKSFSDRDIIVMDPQLSDYYGALQIMGYNNLRGVVVNEIRTKAPAVPGTLARGGLSKRKDIDTDVWTYMREIRKRQEDPRDYADILSTIAARQKERFFRRTAIPKDKPTVRTAYRELVATAREIQSAERRGTFPRTVDNSCLWGCDFRNICYTQLLGGNIDSQVKMHFIRKEQD